MYATDPALWRGLNHLVLAEDWHVLPNRAEQAHHRRHLAAGLLLELLEQQTFQTGFSLLFVEKRSLPGQGDVFQLTNLITLRQVFRRRLLCGGT